MTELTKAIIDGDTELARSIIAGTNLAAAREVASEYLANNTLALEQKTKNFLGWYGDLHNPWNQRHGYRPASFKGVNYSTRQIYPTDEEWDARELAAVYGNVEVKDALSKIPVNQYDSFRLKRRPSNQRAADQLSLAIHNKQLKFIASAFKYLQDPSYHSYNPEWYGNAYYSVMSPLQVAVLPGYDLDMVKLLLDFGASPNQRSTYNSNDYSSYDYFDTVVFKHKESTVDNSIETTVPLKNIKNGTVLFYAMYYNGAEAVDLIKLLLSRGADPTAKIIVDDVEYTAYSYAVANNKTELAAALLAPVNEERSSYRDSRKKCKNIG